MNPSYCNKIHTLETIRELISDWRNHSNKIVFTNGCFDILHLGHVDYLEKAKNLGDKLIVGLNSDRSVSAIKGPSRPIQDETCRSGVMASLASVDAVIIFDENTPLELIESLKPDILVKGGDWHLDKIIGADIVFALGGDVKTIPIIQGYSTTLIEQKIKSQK
ncbi:MAG: D-glycero-beta-D-manno-heptose 1-phosphate adenylyltransferase [Saprospiraceae bacterium]